MKQMRDARLMPSVRTLSGTAETSSNTAAKRIAATSKYSLPIERLRYRRLPYNREIVAFLRRLTSGSSRLSIEDAGRSANGRDLVAVAASKDRPGNTFTARRTKRLRVMIVGSQHGREASAAEAILRFLRDLAEGRHEKLLNRLDFLVFPCANPDGRDLAQQSNGRLVNLNSDYVQLSQPESRAIARAVQEFQPHVLLDVHESSTLKRHSLGLEGYLTDFGAQFDFAGHPAIDSALRELGTGFLLPRILKAVVAKGLCAQRYVGEISSIHEAVSHGSLSARKLRNYAGLQGVLAAVLENQLDRSDLDFPTPRNIAVRTEKQYLSLTAFLEICVSEAPRIFRVQRAARKRMNCRAGYPPIPIAFEYRGGGRSREITLPYRRLHDDTPVQISHPYHGRIVTTRRIARPRALVFTRYQKKVTQFLDNHGIRYAILNRPQSVVASELTPLAANATPKDTDTDEQVLPRVSVRRVATDLAPGTLWVDLSQCGGAMAMLMLDPRSIDTVFQWHPYNSMLVDGRPLFVLPILEEW